MLDSLTGAHWFSTFDLASGYNQVPVSESDHPKTAFCTPFGLFEWNWMPFGLCNAPSTFQRLMEHLFGDQRHQSVLLYLDDIIVFSSSVQQHLQRLRMVLGCLEAEGLKVKLGKCAFFWEKVRYLGHVISGQGVVIDPSKALPSRSAPDIIALQEADPVIGEALKFWRKEQYPNPQEWRLLPKPVIVLLRQWDRFVEQEGILYHKAFRPDRGEKVLQVIVPVALQSEVLTSLHQHHGHQGVERTLELARQRCYWPDMSSAVARWVQECERCQQAKDVAPVA
ncbi:hypothetical protein QQF64_007524 [Cirrhinus molitorella]|uniref:Gypsy retrotransposon integrase-like protein 1 n=1 Tax=Cirrhinus molitorella TaxID=172907 RepID=A0ABR3ME51_9TELE